MNLYVRVRRSGQAWEPAVLLSTGTLGGSQPSVSVGEDGTVAVAWSESPEGAPEQVFAAFSLPDGTWTGPQLLTDPTKEGYWPQVAVDAAGGAAVAWREAADRLADKPTIMAAVAPADELFAAPVPLGTGARHGHLIVALAQAGDGLILFQAEVPSAYDVALRLADVDTLSATISAVRPFGPPNLFSLGFAMRSAGDAVIAVEPGGSPDRGPHTNRRAPHGEFLPGDVLQCPDPIPSSVLAASMDHAGHAGVLWVDHIANDQLPRQVHLSFDHPVDQPGPTTCPKPIPSSPVPYTGSPGTPIRPPGFAPNPASKTLLLGPGRVVMSARRPFLDVRVGCRAACHLRAVPQLSIAKFRRSLAAQEHRVAAGQRIRLRIKLDKTTARRVRRALATKRRALLTLDLTALGTGTTEWQRNNARLRINRR